MLHIETKKQLLEAHKRGIPVKEIVKSYATPKSTVYRLLKQEQERGTVIPRTHMRGRKPSYSTEELAAIKELIDKQCDITAEEIKEKLKLDLCLSSIRTIIREKLGYRYKKRRYMPVSENGPM